MGKQKEILDSNSPRNKKSSYVITPYFLANLSVKTAVISFSVSVATQPLQALLTHFQISNGLSAIRGGFFRSLYRGFIPYAISGQKRGALTVTSKETTRVLEEGEIELPIRQRWVGTFSFAQADHFLSNALYSKAKLESAGIVYKSNFKWSIANYWQLTKVNWGSRSLAGFINFAAIGFIGDYISSFYKFENKLYNQLAGGATSGVVATILTTIPNAYADRKLLASQIEKNRVSTVTSYTMFRQMKSHIHNNIPKKALTFMLSHFCREALVRSPQAALTFSIIFGIDYVMGSDPLQKIWPENASLGITKTA